MCLMLGFTNDNLLILELLPRPIRLNGKDCSCNCVSAKHPTCSYTKNPTVL